MPMSRAVIAVASFIVGALSAGVARDLVRDWWFGPAEVAVLNRDLELGYGNEEGTTCPGSPAGGLLAGTPLVIRKRGIWKLVEVRFQYAGKDLDAATDVQVPPPGFQPVACANSP